MKERLKLEFVKNSFGDFGYILLDNTYINSKTKLNYICPRGCRNSINWNNWSIGKRCPCYCKTTKKTYHQVKLSFKKENCILLEDAYKNSVSKLKYICSNGHHHETTWNAWSLGKRCPSCYGNIKPKIEFIKLEFEKEGYKLLSTKYINNSSKLSFICQKGHRHSITWDGWNTRKQRCGRCKGNIEIKFEDVKSSFKLFGYNLISTKYISAKSTLISICPNNHEYKINWNNWISKGHRCPKCSNNGTSNFEKEVKQVILDSGQTIIENDRTTIMGNKGKFLELDILLPCKTKAIECNGIYWHDRPEAEKKDKIKQKRCKELGIDLLVITDEEWINNPKIKSKLLAFIK